MVDAIAETMRESESWDAVEAVVIAVLVFIFLAEEVLVLVVMRRRLVDL